MSKYKVIALDLDNTLLDSQKCISPENYAALEKAAAMGIEIVPSTGRFFGALPEVVLDLPFVNYIITTNGAAAFDMRTKEAIFNAEIPLPLAEEVLGWLSQYPLIFDCHMDNRGYMSADHYEHCGEWVREKFFLALLLKYRKPVPDIIDFIHARGRDIQKIQFFMKDAAEKDAWIARTEERFPNVLVTSAFINNIEINSIEAGKDKALAALCAHLGCGMDQAIAFGDGLNDRSMIRAAGVGVAMENADDAVKAVADHITCDCDHSGVARGIERYIFER